MVTIQAYDLRNTFNTERNFLLLSGFYPKKENTNTKLYYTCAVLQCFISITILISMVGLMITDFANLSKLTETMLFFMTESAFFFKLINFTYHKNNLVIIEKILSHTIFYGFSTEQLKLIENSIGLTRMVAKVFRFLCIMVVVLYALFPFVDRNSKNLLPLPGWLPWDIRDNLIYYYMTYVFQILSIAVSAYNNSNIDIITVMLITLAAAQFEIFKDNLSHLDYRDEKNTLPGEKGIKAQLKDNIVYHMELIKFIDKIEDTFSTGIFVQFSASVLVICFTSFQMLVVPAKSGQFALLIVYFSCMMNQVAMYCWYGNDIKTKSEDVGRACYMSNWYEAHDLTISKNLLIFTERSKRPVILTAGKIFSLTLLTFTMILRSSYSYFAVLQRIYK